MQVHLGKTIPRQEVKMQAENRRCTLYAHNPYENGTLFLHACSMLAARLQNKRVFGTLLACGWVQQIAFRTHVERAAHTLSVQLVGSVQVK